MNGNYDAELFRKSNIGRSELLRYIELLCQGMIFEGLFEVNALYLQILGAKEVKSVPRTPRSRGPPSARSSPAPRVPVSTGDNTAVATADVDVPVVE